MAISEAQKRAKENYRKRSREFITLDVRKGTREGFKEAAATLGLTLSKLFQYGAMEYVERHAGENIAAKLKQTATAKLSREDRRLFAVLEQLPRDTRLAVLRFAEHLAEKFPNDAGEQNLGGVESELPPCDMVSDDSREG